MNARHASALGLIAVLMFALASCAEPAAPSPRTASGAAEPTPTPSATPTSEPIAATPTAALSCESMISAGTVTALTAQGWTAQSKEFVIGGVSLDDGLLCFWADYTVASDHGQLYGWSALSSPDAATAQSGLLAEGWKREDSAEGVYFTEDPRYAMGTDDDGYGMTYLFGDGWVKFADTKQGLILVEWED